MRQYSGMHRQPDLLDGPRPCDIRQGDQLMSGDGDGRGDFPALPQLAGGSGSISLGSHSALPFFAVEVLGADRTRAGMRHARQAAQRQIQTVIPDFHGGHSFYSMNSQREKQMPVRLRLFAVHLHAMVFSISKLTA